MNKKIVKTIINKCLGYKKNETFLIVTDDVLFSLADEFYQISKTYGVEVLFMSMKAGNVHGEEPPFIIGEALRQADAAILMTSKSLSHTKARKTACKKYGTRIASLPGVSGEILARSIDINYSALNKKAKKIAEIIGKGKRCKVTTPKGTNLTMSMEGRKGFIDSGLYVRKGAFGNLPAGEVCMAPLEGSTNGVLVVDGSAPMEGRIKRPVKLIVKDGYVKNMPFKIIKSKIKHLGKRSLNIAELGIGLNPKAKVTGNTLEDEKACSTAHIAIGNNQSFGGNVYCPSHLDFVIMNPEIFIDGKKLKI